MRKNQLLKHSPTMDYLSLIVSFKSSADDTYLGLLTVELSEYEYT